MDTLILAVEKRQGWNQSTIKPAAAVTGRFDCRLVPHTHIFQLQLQSLAAEICECLEGEEVFLLLLLLFVCFLFV